MAGWQDQSRDGMSSTANSRAKTLLALTGEFNDSSVGCPALYEDDRLIRGLERRARREFLTN